MTSPPSTAGLHPEEYELADLLDGTLEQERAHQFREHLADCAACREVLGQAGAPFAAATTATAGTARTVRLPTAVVETLKDLRVTRPMPGHVWRLRAPNPDGPGEIAELVVLLEVEDDVLVAPATSDLAENTDMWTVPSTMAGTDVIFTVWTSLAMPLGLETLDVYLGDIEPDPLLEAHRRLRRGLEPLGEARRHRHVDDELRAYREMLRAQLALFSEARLVDSHRDEALIDVRAALAEAQWTPSKLRVVTGISAGEARAVLTGQADLTDDQIRNVELELGGIFTPGSSAVPPGKLRAVASPVRRHRYAAVAQFRGVDPWAFRAEQAHFALAARHNLGADDDWEFLVEQHLRRLESEVRDATV
jgi:hypothetical protein